MAPGNLEKLPTPSEKEMKIAMVDGKGRNQKAQKNRNDRVDLLYKARKFKTFHILQKGPGDNLFTKTI